MSVEIFLIYSQGGAITSSGMDILSHRLKTLYPSINVSTYEWNKWAEIYNKIYKLHPTTKIGLVGYSLGANATTWIASQHNLVHHKIDLLIALDPTIWSIITPLGENVKRVIAFQNMNPLDIFGHAKVVGPHVETHEVFDFHLTLDFSDKFQSTVIKEVGKLI
ncbi:MAG TPA: hypothetical protein VEP90_14330 [Methylomirabilota bacterium]|nr:hypothetical protein [Methylomirabilota bacterium]